MDLILLIILLVVYFAIRAKADYQSSRNRAILAREETLKRIWMQRVTNRTLEQELKRKIFSTQEREELIGEIRRDGYNVSKSEEHNRESLIRAMMAKNGYLPYNDALGNTLISYATESNRQILLWCDHKLREQGVPTRLVKSMAPCMYMWEVLIR